MMIILIELGKTRTDEFVDSNQHGETRIRKSAEIETNIKWNLEKETTVKNRYRFEMLRKIRKQISFCCHKLGPCCIPARD